jgi:hypothetical protein
MKKLLSNIGVLAFGLLIGLCILELILRVYNPFPFRVKGDKIILPANQRYVVRNNTITRLDSVITHSKNSLGFRGPELPKNFSGYLSIIAVGGSTTECANLSDHKDWPNLLGTKLNKYLGNVWMNNAGLDGQSTFGHIILLNDYILKIKPKIILFLVGTNDVERDDLNEYDKDKIQDSYQSWKNFIAKKSELVALSVNFARVYSAKKRNLTHKELKLKEVKHFVVPDSIMDKELKRQTENYLPGYKKRLLSLIETCKKNNIEPIFLTQPLLTGPAIDSLTGVNLSTIEVSPINNGILTWKILELYNQITKETGKEMNCMVIDLANKLPKNSIYFYDVGHHTNQGAEAISSILFNELSLYFKNKSIVKSPDRTN